MRRIVIMMLSVMAILASCTKVGSDYNGKYDMVIRLRVDTEGNTKGSVTTNDALKSSGAFSMMAYLSDKYVMREDLDDEDSPLIPADDTKPVADGGEPKLFGAEDGLYFSGSGNVTLSSSGWSIAPDADDNPYNWVYDVDTYFWAWHPVTVAGRKDIVATKATTTYPTDPKAPRSPYTGELTFNYTTPTPNGTTDATNAVDLLFAYSKKKFVKKKNLTDNDKTVNITFHHALSQVRFCVCTDDGTFDKSLKIMKISITNLKDYGKASFTDSGDAENNEYAYDTSHKSYDKFVWTGQTGTKTFGQTYDADFSTSTVSDWTASNYTDDNGTETTSDDKTYTYYTCQNVFFMIPQTVKKNETDDTKSNKIIVAFDYKGATIVRTIDIADATGVDWLGDHYYTYKINATTLGRDIDFSVSLVGWSNRKEEIFF